MSEKNLVLLGGNGFVGKYLQKMLPEYNIKSFSSNELDLTSDSSVDKLVELFQSEPTVIFLSALTPDRGRDTTTFLSNVKMSHHVALAMEKITQISYLYKL